MSANRVMVVEPAVVVPMPEPIFSAAFSVAAEEVRAALAQSRPYPAAELAINEYLDVDLYPRDAVLYDGDGWVVEETIYSWKRTHIPAAVENPAGEHLPRIKSSWVAGLSAQQVEGVTAIWCFHQFYRVYTHWLCECLFSVYLVCRERVHLGPISMIKLIFPPLESHERSLVIKLIEAFGLSAQNVMECEASPQSLYRFERLLVPTSLYMRTWLHPEVFSFAEYIKSVLLPKDLLTAPRGDGDGDLIYISRRDAGARKIVNELELEEALQKIGFKTLMLSGKSIQEQAELFYGARMVVGPHGSGFANFLFARPGTPLVELRGARHLGRSPFWDRSFLNIAYVMQCPFGFIVCEGNDESEEWTVPVSSIIDTLQANMQKV